MSRTPQPPPYETVVFDCDSTLSSIEGIEDLARGRRAEVRELTARAMAGEIPLEAVYGARLSLIRPTAEQVVSVGRRYVETLLPNARPLVSALHALGKRVAIVSGGLLPAVRAVGDYLRIPDPAVHAVAIVHDETGAYVGYDEASPLARGGGKLAVLRGMKAPVVLVGDGATDLEAAPACACFIAFGGVARREAVFAAADATCDKPDLAALLPYLCDQVEIGQLAERTDHRALVEQAYSYYPS